MEDNLLLLVRSEDKCLGSFVFKDLTLSVRLFIDDSSSKIGSPACRKIRRGSLFHKEIWFFVGRSISPDIRGRAEALVTSRSLDAFLKKWSLLGGVIPILWMLEGTLAVAPNAGGYRIETLN